MENPTKEEERMKRFQTLKDDFLVLFKGKLMISV